MPFHYNHSTYVFLCQLFPAVFPVLADISAIRANVISSSAKLIGVCKYPNTPFFIASSDRRTSHVGDQQYWNRWKVSMNLLYNFSISIFSSFPLKWN
jgi:hypothetical protein